MTEMVERLRDVVIEEIKKQDGFLMDNRPLVRAVLEALREPTEDMLHIGGRVDADLSSGRASAPYEDTARDVWQAMLSAAIGGKS